MRISATIETISSVIAGIATAAILMLLLGCNMQAQQQEPQWPPVVSFKQANLSGTVEVSTPAGPVVVDVKSGMVSGDGSAAVIRADISADVEFEVNGARQAFTLRSNGAPSGEDWAQCLNIDAESQIIKGLGVTIKAKPPGLHASCGPAVLEVQTPLGNWSTADANPSPPLEE